MQRHWLIGLVVLNLLALAVLLWPVHVTCGVPGYSCTPAPNPQGIVWRPYEVEPLGVMMLETVFHTSIPIYYTRGTSGESVR